MHKKLYLYVQFLQIFLLNLQPDCQVIVHSICSRKDFNIDQSFISEQ